MVGNGEPHFKPALDDRCGSKAAVGETRSVTYQAVLNGLTPLVPWETRGRIAYFGLSNEYTGPMRPQAGMGGVPNPLAGGRPVMGSPSPDPA